MTNSENSVKRAFSCYFCHRELFTNIQGFLAHRKACVKYRQISGKGPPVDCFRHTRGWAKGLSRDDPRLKNFYLANMQSRQRRLEDKSHPFLNWRSRFPEKDQASRAKQSGTMRQQFQKGNRIPAVSAAGGAVVYFQTAECGYRLRSSYEAVFALALLYFDRPIHYEDVRVFNESFSALSDFRLGQTIFEIKGHRKFLKPQVAELFAENGWRYIGVDYQQIGRIIQIFEKRGLPIRQLISEILQAKRNRQVFLLNAEKFFGSV